ncbi:hypothetical protein HTIA_p2835 (plasmid) [Halorhabdus tiamatea SARL4B]|uniref:Uncharacterized protein n=1 Tax=Halorhabdus tiamatea SARL4B TaxID=1033806 RepID=S6CW17_9EURY|nr:hypothetical protein HTIA_p2835 [Halorhabdus tiamatea SARL4B]
MWEERSFLENHPHTSIFERSADQFSAIDLNRSRIGADDTGNQRE